MEPEARRGGTIPSGRAQDYFNLVFHLTPRELNQQAHLNAPFQCVMAVRLHGTTVLEEIYKTRMVSQPTF
ncbi:hypothetical protein PGTUg99_017525 [Puccinia graminis f. sp. tritici]|uniref:Uncharacterized protein n=1 Tax=Puccinia graminis f. sp. tritici TaxID=56615 RepID=A0A5B0Q1G2_PUCGR|nr:hypothetical protein PGTUg99_017525 [Puccinia graminis f. sp. tritici]